MPPSRASRSLSSSSPSPATASVARRPLWLRSAWPTVTSPSTQLRQVTFGSPRVMSSAIAAGLDELLGGRILRVAENDIDIVTMVAPGFLGFKHVGLNLAVRKPAGVLPHLMEGYLAGVASLDLNTFVPTFALGVRRSIVFAVRRLLSRSS